MNEREEIEQLREMINELKSQLEFHLKTGRKSWFQEARDLICSKDIIPKTDVESHFSQLHSYFTLHTFLQTFPEIKLIKLPMRGEKAIFAYVGKENGFHPMKPLVKNWYMLTEGRAILYEELQKKEALTDEQKKLIKLWSKKHLSKWLHVEDSGIYRKTTRRVVL